MLFAMIGFYHRDTERTEKTRKKKSAPKFAFIVLNFWLTFLSSVFSVPLW